MGRSVLISCLFAILSGPLFAQTAYSDYARGESIIDDNFDNSGSGYAFEEFSLSDGWLMHTRNKGLALIPVTVDQSRDFEMETYVQINPGYNPDIIFGDFFAMFSLSYDDGLRKPPVNCLYVYRDTRPGFRHMPDPKYTVVPNKKHAGADYYLVTFRKVGSFLYLFVNKELIAQTPFRSFVKSSMGYWGQVNADYIKVSYLEKAAAPAAPALVAPLTVAGTEGTTVKSGGKYYGLIIGVSQYADARLNLDRPAKDAQQMKDLLVSNYSFEETSTVLMLNPTRQKIIAELFRLRKVVGPNDNLLIFYAGHGYWDKDARQGYWWAADATADDPSAWLSNSDVREQIRSINSGHTLLITDACFSGGIFKTRSAESIRSATIDLQLLYKMPSRRAITSGTMTTVPDQSVFFEYLSKRLRENPERYLSSQQLFDSFRVAIINNSLVVPQDGVIADTGDEGGDFIFIRK